MERGFVEQCVALAEGAFREGELIGGDAALRVGVQFFEDFGEGTAGSVGADTGAEREGAGVFAGGETSAGTVGPRFFFAEIEVEAAAEGGAERVVHQGGAVVVAGGVGFQAGDVADAEFGLRGLRDVHDKEAGFRDDGGGGNCGELDVTHGQGGEEAEAADDFFLGDVADDDEFGATGRDKAGVVILDVGECEIFYGFFGAGRTDAENARGAVVDFGEHLGGDEGGLGFAGLEAFEHLALEAVEGGGGEFRAEQAFCEERQGFVHVLFQGLDAEIDVVEIAADGDGAAEGLELELHLLGGAVLRILVHHVGVELGEAGFRGGSGETELAAGNGQREGDGWELAGLGPDDFGTGGQRGAPERRDFDDGVGAVTGEFAAVEGVGGLGIFQTRVAVVGSTIRGGVGLVIGGGDDVIGGGFDGDAEHDGGFALEIFFVDALDVGLGDGGVAFEVGGNLIGRAGVGLPSGEAADLAGDALEVVDQLGFDRAGELGDIRIGDAAGGEGGEGIVDQFFRGGEGGAGGGDDAQGEFAGEFAGAIKGGGAEGLLGLGELLVEDGIFSLAEDLGEAVEGGFVGVKLGDGRKGEGELGLAGVVVDEGDVAVAVEDGGGEFGGLDGGAAGDGAEVFLDEGNDGGGVDIATDGEGGVVGAIPAEEEVLQVGDGDAVEVFDVADGEPGIWVAVGVEGLGGDLAGEAVGAVVVVLAAFVFHGAALHFEFLLGDGVEEEAHAVGLEPEHLLELVIRDGLVVVGAIAIGGAVEGAAGGGDDLEMLVVADVVAALKHHVFEKVGEAGLADFLAGGADVVGDVDVDDGIAVVLVDDEGEAVGQDVFRVRDKDLGRR